LFLQKVKLALPHWLLKKKQTGLQLSFLPIQKSPQKKRKILFKNWKK